MKQLLINKRYISYSPELYKEILECYDYEVNNPTVYGTIMT